MGCPSTMCSGSSRIRGATCGSLQPGWSAGVGAPACSSGSQTIPMPRAPSPRTGPGTSGSGSTAAASRDGRRARCRCFHRGEQVPPGFVFTLFVDRKGRLWIGTESGGLVRVDDPGADVPAFAAVTRDPNVADVPVYAMMEDRAEQFYLSTARGVLRFDERRGVTRRYSLADGFTGHMARTVHSDRSGALWFGTRQGLSQLMPEPDLEPAPLPVFIDRLVVGGAPQPTSLRGSQADRGAGRPAGQPPDRDQLREREPQARCDTDLCDPPRGRGSGVEPANRRAHDHLCEPGARIVPVRGARDRRRAQQCGPRRRVVHGAAADLAAAVGAARRARLARSPSCT